MRWWAGKHLGGVAFVPPHGKPRLSYCVKYCELTALVAVRLDCASFCRLCSYVRSRTCLHCASAVSAWAEDPSFASAKDVNVT